MNNEEQQLDVVKKYLNLFFSKHKLIIGCLLLALSVGFAIYLATPKVYQSTASIIYQQQKINPSKLSPDEEKRIDEMVNTVTQQVVSRTSLEKIIQEFNLYPEMREKMPIEDVIGKMRTDHIRISVQRTKGNVFTVSYQGAEARVVMRVTNALASNSSRKTCGYGRSGPRRQPPTFRMNFACPRNPLIKKTPSCATIS